MFLKPKPQNPKPETLSEVEDLGTVYRGPSDSIYLEVASKSFFEDWGVCSVWEYCW